jgi:hypothetical protein
MSGHVRNNVSRDNVWDNVRNNVSDNVKRFAEKERSYDLVKKQIMVMS